MEKRFHKGKSNNGELGRHRFFCRFCYYSLKYVIDCGNYHRTAHNHYSGIFDLIETGTEFHIVPIQFVFEDKSECKDYIARLNLKNTFAYCADKEEIDEQNESLRQFDEHTNHLRK